MKEKSDHELMRLIHEKHRPALEEIYDRYVNLIYSFALRISRGDKETANDIVQQVFLRIWTTQSLFDSKKGQLTNWLITMTRNISIDHIRKEKKHKQTEIKELTNDIPDPNTKDVLQLVSKRLMTSEIRHSLNKLTEVQRRLIQLLYWDGYTLKEIAEIENEPIGTIKNRLHQALKKLHHMLADGKGGVKDGSKRLQ